MTVAVKTEQWYIISAAQKSVAQPKHPTKSVIMRLNGSEEG